MAKQKLTAQSRGAIADQPVVELWLWVYLSSFSGMMVLSSLEVKKSFAFEQGRLIGARSNLPKETIGAILLEKGKIQPSDQKKVFQMAKERPGLLHGEAYVELGVIDYPYLYEVLQTQILQRAYDVFHWGEGKFGFVDRIPEGTPKTSVSKTVPEICFRGLLERYKAASELETELKPVATRDNDIEIGQLNLIGREMGLFRAVTGRSSVGQMLEGSKMEPSVARAILLSLRDLGFVSWQSDNGGGEKEDEKKGAHGGFPEIEEVRAHLQEVSKKNHYEVLGLGREATSSQVKQAYFSLAKKYHPDRTPENMDRSERKDVESLFARIAEAYGVLSNDASRREYQASLDLKASGVTTEKVTEVLHSEESFLKGMDLVRRSLFKEAMTALSEAIRLYPDEPEYHLQLGWATWRVAQKAKNSVGMSKGRRLIEQAREHKKLLDQVHYYLGMIAKMEGDINQARDSFEKAISINPGHPSAGSELRLINMRSEKKRSKGLGGLFGKK